MVELTQRSSIQIGSINLQDFEVPQSLRFGGRHRLTVHALASGKRIIERLGPDDNEIQFEGVFSGTEAEQRVRAFDNLRISGEVVWLTWESFRRQVILKLFVADYRNPAWISYKASCLVVDQPRINLIAAANIASLVLADLSSAFSASQVYTSSLTNLQSAICTKNAILAGTSDQSRALAATALTLNMLDTQIKEQSGSLVQSTISSDPIGLSNTYISKVNAAGLLANTVCVRAYVGRIGNRLSGLRQ